MECVECRADSQVSAAGFVIWLGEWMFALCSLHYRKIKMILDLNSIFYCSSKIQEEIA